MRLTIGDTGNEGQEPPTQSAVVQSDQAFASFQIM